MRIYQIALAVLVFSLLTSFFNEIAIYDYQQPEIGLNVSESEITGVMELNSSDQFDSEESFKEDIPEIGGIESISKAWNVLKNFLWNALLVGEIFKKYVPGQVGALFGNMISIVILAIYGWGLVQVVFKINTKGMD